METCIIVNPNAGSAGEIEALRERLAELPGAEVFFTAAPGDAEARARDALRAGVRTVVAAGGDGTLNEVVNGLAADFGRARLGLLPLGTGNDFARSIGVPADLEEALDILAAGRVRTVDVGRATVGNESRHFLNMAVGGFSPVVSEKAEEAKPRWGPLAYLRGAVDALPELQEFSAVLTLGGGDVVVEIETETYNLVLANGRFVASGIPIAPQAALDDGLFDVMIIPAASFPQMARLLPRILLGRHLDSDLLLFRRAARIEVESTPHMTFNVDGEILGEAGEGPARFEVLPQALEMVVGPDDGS
jgi:diacylglycerol kinase (ATP)